MIFIIYDFLHPGIARILANLAEFVDHPAKDTGHMEQYTDASVTHGCGAYFQGAWQPHQQLSIQWQEPVAGTLTWGYHWYQDILNQATVHLWEGKAWPRNPPSMGLFMHTFLTAAKHNFTVMLRHLLGKICNCWYYIQEIISFMHLVQ